MKKLFLILALCVRQMAYASPFPEEDFVPIVYSGYGCYVSDEAGRQIMVADVLTLHFDNKSFKSIDKMFSEGQNTTRYQSGKFRLIFKKMQWQTPTDEDNNNGILQKATGEFDYYKRNKLIYQGKFSMECAV